MERWYNTAEGLSNKCETLADLHFIKKTRSEAFYKNNERLNQFVINGEWFLDTCGNFGKLEKPTIREMIYLKDSAVPVEEIYKLFPDVRMAWSPSFIPTDKDVCDICENGWRLDNCHDSLKVNRLESQTDVPKFRHSKCQQCYLSDSEIEYFNNVFSSAGFTNVKLKQIPNQYCSREDLAPPWFRADTAFGEFTIGWRKRVISIHWDKVGEDFSSLFINEEVTKGKYMIHAYGEKKAIEYLSLIRNKMVS